jgi:DNA polymerase-3 subunit gamma/tau
MIAIAADGGMRDAESLLAQVLSLSDKNITTHEVSQILGTTSSNEIFTLLSAFVTKDINLALKTINTVIVNGYNMEAFIRSLIEKLRILLFLSLNTNKKDVKNLINISTDEFTKLQDIATKTSTQNILNMIEECVTAFEKTKITTIPQLPIEIASVNICKNTTITKSQQVKQELASSTKNKPTTSQQTPKSTTDTKWKNSIKKIEQKNKSISTLLKRCELESHKNNTLIISVSLPFYQEKLTETETRAMIEEIITQEFEIPYKIEVIIKEDKKQDKSSELLDYAKQLMGNTVTE